MKLNLNTVALHLNAHLIGVSTEINAVSIDSRTLKKGDLYIAISGENFDGHNFTEAAEKAGACALLVEHQVKSLLPQLVVKNTRLALAELAGLARQKSKATIFSVTGSNGKTTVKEMLAIILSVNASVLATEGNLNNEIGVPLTLLKLSVDHRYAVIEMGANHRGEIAFSSRAALANIALINNVAEAHLEGFGSLEGIAKAKGEIVAGLKASGIAILNQDDPFYSLWVKIAANRSHYSFSLHDKSANVYATEIESTIENNAFVTTFNLHTATEKIAISLKLAGQHNIYNALAAATAALTVNIPLVQIQQGLEKLLPVKGRLQPWVSRYGNIVIDDSYNANPASLKVAIEVLKFCQGDSWLILGELGELGDKSQEIHQQLGVLIREQGIKRLFAIGTDARYSVEEFGEGALFFESQVALITSLKAGLKGEEALLIKGSRAQGMEQVAAALIDNFRK
ncbi:MAG: UDP-N-acetylmuramoyl-tripeptide--D-alanyl-D-alanine ligase [Methylococcales bacterium]|nr:UDP-N-acetylmuramoyl-tripeptide--D-alanyl-D-alanine ligase [Methylococcales bacterium]